MGEFAKSVRADRIAGPRRRAFTPVEWSRQFSEVRGLDGDDGHIYAVGLVIHQKLDGIRKVLKFSSATTASATTKLRAFAAMANYDFLVAKSRTEQAILKYRQELLDEQEGFVLDELEAVKLELPGGFEWSPDEVVESLVEGIEVPVKVILQGSPDLSGNPRLHDVAWFDVAMELNLGIMYRFAEDIWDECLWNDYRMSTRSGVREFFPHDLDVVLSYRIGLARRGALSMSFQLLATKFHRENLAKGLYPSVREIHAIERRGKRQIIHALKSGQLTQTFDHMWVQRGYAAEPYYRDLLREPEAELGGLTLMALLDAWMVIAQAAHVLASSVETMLMQPLDERQSKHARIAECASIFQIDALVNALQTAVGIGPADGRRLIEFFTFKGQPGQEIWAQPLIPVGPNTVVPVFAATAGPNLRRLVDVWMRQAGIDLTRRGPAFESYIRTITVEAMRTSKLLAGHAHCIDHDYTFKSPNWIDEQMDLVFVLGDSVFVAETKCILEPTDAKGVATHRKAVLAAADQVLRKVAALDAARDVFVSEVERLGITLTLEFKVVPLVVVSTTTHVGIAAKGVAVIDEFILRRYFEGELQDIVVQPEDFSFHEYAKTTFYANAEEAERGAADYFAKPPQLRRFFNGIQERAVPVYRIDPHDWPGRYVTLECNLK